MQQPPLGSPVAGEGDSAGPQVSGIARRIVSAISLGMLTVGERLPTEAELASQFGVAVATLRKALATLRDQGVVETRRGRNGGTFIVASPYPSPELLQSSLKFTSLVALRDFFDEQAAVSGMAAKLAAERIAPHSRTRLAEFAFQAREARSARDRSMADSRFHFEVAVLSQSPRLLASERRLQSELSPFLWCEEICRASVQTSFTDHLALVMAVEQRQPEEAQRLAVAHVHSNMRLIIEGKLALTGSDVIQLSPSEEKQAP
ncbi:FadR/GntR family transcriptional regulator [Leucobacter salsicius]|uniref:FadR/GntR family transcriptional regulator n=1 Tax=Leucobacter salsicius TaxID=664638 RepID=UPI0003485E0C|nr:GntR family transcriptional regulator [Leucobacter salsicius]